MKQIIFIAIVIVMAAACTEPLDVDYEGKSTNSLIVDGSITNDTAAHQVILSRTMDYTSNELVYETDAVVTISDGEKEFQLSEKEPGMYYTESTVFGEIGKTYILNIETLDGKTYEAVSKMEPISTIDSITFKKEYVDFLETDFYKVYFFGQESPELGQYYYWDLYINDSLMNDTISETRFEEDAWVNGVYLSDFDIYWMTDEEIKGNADTLEVELVMYSMPKEYYMYLFELMSETDWRGSPWDATPANVSTNISNGGLGFFVARAKTKANYSYVRTLEENLEAQ